MDLFNSICILINYISLGVLGLFAYTFYKIHKALELNKPSDNIFGNYKVPKNEIITSNNVKNDSLGDKIKVDANKFPYITITNKTKLCPTNRVKCKKQMTDDDYYISVNTDDNDGGVDDDYYIQLRTDIHIMHKNVKYIVKGNNYDLAKLDEDEYFNIIAKSTIYKKDDDNDVEIILDSEIPVNISSSKDKNIDKNNDGLTKCLQAVQSFHMAVGTTIIVPAGSIIYTEHFDTFITQNDMTCTYQP
jgi:hypothetical protein